MGQINWTQEAERWVREIYDYIAQDNPGAAHRLVDSICNKVDVLRSFPQTGYRYWNEPNKEVRVLLLGHYRIVYLVKGNGDIDILGVFHGSMEIKRYLKI